MSLWELTWVGKYRMVEIELKKYNNPELYSQLSHCLMILDYLEFRTWNFQETKELKGWVNLEGCVMILDQTLTISGLQRPEIYKEEVVLD